MTIRFALIAEGGTEEPLVRILALLCGRASNTTILGVWGNDVLAQFEPGKKVAEQIQTVIEAHGNLNLLFIHRDADAPTDGARRHEIQQALQMSGFSGRAIAVVPIQETEAWLLTSESAIRETAGNPNGKAPLGLPKDVEATKSPKEVLRQALVNAAKPGRQQQEIRSNSKTFGRLRRRLFETLDIDGPVTELHAWQRLIEDIQHACSGL